MAGSMVDAAGLARALDVVVACMKHKTSKLLFNQPVDLSLFPDYKKIVKQPMDLGTVLARLREGEASGWQHCVYRSADGVLADVSLIWSNCDKFNSTPADAPTRQLCAEVKSAFDKRWQAAGLPPPSAKAQRLGTGGRCTEDAVGERYTVRQGALGCTLHILPDEATLCLQHNPR